MTDDFDREAEREKLREQFGEEEEDRERTQQLSDLLLKGATMTDIHCPECGDPIFRHEGRQFCPSCQREVASGEGQQATAGQAAAQDPTSPDPDPATDGHEEIAVDTPEAEAEDEDAESEPEPAAGTEPSEIPDTDAPETPEPETQQPTPQQSTPQQSTPQQPDASPAQGSAQPTGASEPSATPRAPTGGDASGLMPARQHLTRTVNRLAQQAAAEEDPGRKREFLAATREAAEALEAVRDAE